MNNKDVNKTYFYIFIGSIILAFVLTGLFIISKFMPEDPYAFSDNNRIEQLE